jgi:hypothetical protein
MQPNRHTDIRLSAFQAIDSRWNSVLCPVVELRFRGTHALSRAVHYSTGKRDAVETARFFSSIKN